MSQGVLTIHGDGTAAVRAFGDVTQASRRAALACVADWRRVGSAVASTLSRLSSDDARAEAARVRESRRAAQARESAEQGVSRVARAESSYRQNANRTEADKAISESDRVLRTRQRSERQATQASIHEANRRTAIDRQRAREQTEIDQRRARRIGNAGRALTGAGRVALSAATDVMSQSQDARERRAVAQRELGVALYQTGAGAGEVRERMGDVTRFAARTGISTQDVAAAANAAQTEFSSLTGSSQQDRASRFRDLLSTIELGRNTGNDPAEFVRLQGMLSQSGFDAQAQRRMLLFTAGASQAGAVEAGTLTRQAMPSIMARMAQATAALGPNATPAARQEAAAGAFREQVATLQVARGFGMSPTRAGNAVSAMNTAMAGSRVQDNMLRNLRTRRDSSRDSTERARIDALIGDLYEADPTRARGSQRLRRGTGSLQVAEAFARRMGNDATGFSNIFAGSGVGNAQSLQANWRALQGVMLSTDTQGVSGAERTRRLMGANVALSDSDVGRGAAIFGSDPLAEQIKRQELRDTALTDNTSALGRLSMALESYRAASPIAAATAAAVSPVAEMVAAQRFQTQQDQARLSRSPAADQARREYSQLGWLERFQTRNTGGQEAWVRARAAGIEQERAQPTFAPDQLQALTNAVTTGISRATVTVDPRAAEHAEGNARSDTGRTPTP